MAGSSDCRDAGVSVRAVPASARRIGMGSDATLHSLAGQLRSGRIDRRRFMQGAAALGATATAISSALRVAPTRAQDAGEVLFWCDFVANDFANVKAVADAYNAQATGAK